MQIKFILMSQMDQVQIKCNTMFCRIICEISFPGDYLLKLEMHRCIPNTIAADALVLMHQIISIYSANQIFKD